MAEDIDVEAAAGVLLLDCGDGDRAVVVVAQVAQARIGLAEVRLKVAWVGTTIVFACRVRCRRVACRELNCGGGWRRRTGEGRVGSQIAQSEITAITAGLEESWQSASGWF